MVDTLTVTPVVQARQGLSQVLARFRAEGESAAPMVLGSHRAPEAVLLPYERYRSLLAEIEEFHAFRERYLADVTALAAVRLEGQEPDMFGHWVASQRVLGELSDNEAIAELRRHHTQARVDGAR